VANSKDEYAICSVGDVPAGKSKTFTLKAGGEIALFNVDGKFHAISGKCQHKQGPLGKGTLDGKVVTCPWHGWKYSIVDGKSPHEGGDSVDSYETRVANGTVFVNTVPANRGERISKPHEKYSRLEQAVKEYLAKDDALTKVKIHILGISTTNANDKVAPRPSTSESALVHALDYSREHLGGETILIKLRDLYFKDCEGYYSKNAKACIFPCSISEMDKEDQMIEVYEKMILWADIVMVATPIRWGSASSLYYKMVQRLNSVQNQITTHGNMLIKNKVAGFIITGGQDNVQHVAGEMMSFWSQTGFVFGKFPFVGWSRGWYAEDTENNFDTMNKQARFTNDIEGMVRNAMTLAELLKKADYDKLLEGKHPTNLDSTTT
jgi:nitrite reductase/ring-hydroxylating ferredoxin subunit/multimeric flavodoxin WrbA